MQCQFCALELECHWAGTESRSWISSMYYLLFYSLSLLFSSPLYSLIGDSLHFLFYLLVLHFPIFFLYCYFRWEFFFLFIFFTFLKQKVHQRCLEFEENFKHTVFKGLLGWCLSLLKRMGWAWSMVTFMGSNGDLQKLCGNHDAASLVGQCHENQSCELGEGNQEVVIPSVLPRSWHRGRSMSEHPTANTRALAPF